MSEESIRKRVQDLRSFYMECLNYAIVNVILILVWMFLGDEIFWPKYVIIIWGGVLAFKAYRCGLYPVFIEKSAFLSKKLSFMKDEWEDKKVQELMGRKKSSTPKASPAKNDQVKVVARPKKTAAKKKKAVKVVAKSNTKPM